MQLQLLRLLLRQMQGLLMVEQQPRTSMVALNGLRVALETLGPLRNCLWSSDDLPLSPSYGPARTPSSTSPALRDLKIVKKILIPIKKKLKALHLHLLVIIIVY